MACRAVPFEKIKRVASSPEVSKKRYDQNKKQEGQINENSK